MDFYSWVWLLVITILFEERAIAFGTVDYNDECEFVDIMDPTTFVSRLEEWKYCDTNRGLQCIPGLGRCGCILPTTIYRGGKCRAKVNNGCIVKDYKLECVEYATCTRNHTSLTFRCKCQRGYLSNAEGTSCFSTLSYQNRRYYNNNYYYGDASGQFAPHILYYFLFHLLLFNTF